MVLKSGSSNRVYPDFVMENTVVTRCKTMVLNTGNPACGRESRDLLVSTIEAIDQETQKRSKIDHRVFFGGALSIGWMITGVTGISGHVITNKHTEQGLLMFLRIDVEWNK